MIPATRASVSRVAAASGGGASREVARRTPVAAPPRWSRRRGVLSVFATVAAVGFLGAYLVVPTGAALAEATSTGDGATTLYAAAQSDAQSLVVDIDADASAPALTRGSYQVFVKPKPKPVVPPAAQSTKASSGWAPPSVVPDPGSAQAIAFDMVAGRGWGTGEFDCLVALWKKESGWRVNAHNKSSGAYGIPQALPGTKMGSAGADWETNPATQITWGLGYISGRYGTPCGAWGHSQARGWY